MDGYGLCFVLFSAFDSFFSLHHHHHHQIMFIVHRHFFVMVKIKCNEKERKKIPRWKCCGNQNPNESNQFSNHRYLTNLIQNLKYGNLSIWTIIIHIIIRIKIHWWWWWWWFDDKTKQWQQETNKTEKSFESKFQKPLFFVGEKKRKSISPSIQS